MAGTKKFTYGYEEYGKGGKNAETMVDDILADPEFAELDGVTVGCWGSAYEDDCQPIIDGIIQEKEKFSHIKKLFIGDMDFEECEVSWIIQGNYSELWKAMPQLTEFTVKGSTDLTLGDIDLPNLKSLEVICGGLPTDIIKSVQNAKLPNLERLVLYIGVEGYGFDGSAEDIKEMLEKSDFPKLKYLGIVDSEIQDELAEVVLNCKYMDKIETLDLSYGTLTDKGGDLIAEKIGGFPNIKKVELEHHFLSDEGIKRLEDAVKAAGKEIRIEDQMRADEYGGQIYYYAMLTE